MKWARENSGETVSLKIYYFLCCFIYFLFRFGDALFELSANCDILMRSLGVLQAGVDENEG